MGARTGAGTGTRIERSAEERDRQTERERESRRDSGILRSGNRCVRVGRRDKGADANY